MEAEPRQIAESTSSESQKKTDKLNPWPNLDRIKGYMKYAGAALTPGLMFLSTACGAEAPTKNSLPPAASLFENSSVSVDPLQRFVDSAFETAEDTMPGLKPVSKSIRGINIIKTDSQTPTIVLNYSKKDLKPKAVESVYKSMESTIKNDKGIQYLRYKYRGQERFLKFNLSGHKKRIMVLLPENIQGFTDSFAATNYLSQGNALSYTKDPLFTYEIYKTGPAMITQGFTTESCNQVIDVLPMRLVTSKNKKEYVEVKDNNEKILSQELGCGTLGYAAAARMIGVKYENYKNYIQRNTFYVKTTPDLKNLLTVNQQVYNSFPASGTIVE